MKQKGIRIKEHRDFHRTRLFIDHSVIREDYDLCAQDSTGIFVGHDFSLNRNELKASF